MTYKPIYKCRMCGKEVTGMGFRQEKMMALMHDTMDAHNFDKNGKLLIGIYNGHYCADGSMGFADFQGFRAVEE